MKNAKTVMPEVAEVAEVAEISELITSDEVFDALANPLAASVAAMALAANAIDDEGEKVAGKAGEYALGVLRRKAANLPIDGLTGRTLSRKTASNFQTVYNGLVKAGFAPADIVAAAAKTIELKISKVFGSGQVQKGMATLIEKGLLTLNDGQKAEIAAAQESATAARDKKALEATKAAAATEAAIAESAVTKFRENSTAYAAGEWLLARCKHAKIEFSGALTPEQLTTLADSVRAELEVAKNRKAEKQLRDVALARVTLARAKVEELEEAIDAAEAGTPRHAALVKSLKAARAEAGKATAAATRYLDGAAV